MSVFESFKLLKVDMIASGWVIEAFPFNYKNRDYIVLAKLYEDGEKAEILFDESRDIKK